MSASAVANNAVEQEVIRQSFSYKIPRTLEGAEAIFTDPKTGEVNEKAFIICLRAGIKQILNNRLRQEATEKDKDGNPAFQQVDGTYDASALLLKEPARQVLSQREKLQASMEKSGLPAAVIQDALASYDRNVSPDSEPEGDTYTETSEFSVVLGGKDGKQLIMRAGRQDDEE